MASENKATVFLTGKIMWAKILGKPRPNYDGDAREWAFEWELDPKGIETLKAHGLVDRVKGKGYKIGEKGQFADREPFLQLRKPEFNKQGEPNKPIRVYDHEDKAWNQETLIGNDSTGVLKLDIRDYGKGKKKGMYPAAIRIDNLVPYESSGSEFSGFEQEGAPKTSKSEKKDTFREDFGLDDPID